jgi:hypothetical protein
MFWNGAALDRLTPQSGLDRPWRAPFTGGSAVASLSHRRPVVVVGDALLYTLAGSVQIGNWSKKTRFLRGFAQFTYAAVNPPVFCASVKETTCDNCELMFAIGP